MKSERSARPFLKWVGGKRQLLPDLMRAVEAAGPFTAYHEPFLGGGALFFALSGHARLPRPTHLSDLNANLIDCYLGIRDELDAVLEHLAEHEIGRAHV